MGAPKLEHLPHYTYDDYVTWEGRWELVYGVAYNMAPAPAKKHQKISQKIGWLLESALSDCPRCEALLPVDWKIGEDTVVQPDNLVVCDEDMEGAYIVKAPLVIFEVLSKSTAAKDTRLKYELYEEEGVRFYVIVDPDENNAKLYKLYNGKYIKEGDFGRNSYKFEFDECGFEFDFSKIWG